MAGEEVYIAKLSAWIARALGDTAGFDVEFDTEALGFQMPDAVRNDPAVKAAGNALADAAGVLRDAGDKLDAAILSGAGADLAQAFIRLFEGLYGYVDAANAILAGITAKAGTLPAPQANATQAFAALIPRRLMDFFVITLLEQQMPRLAFLLKLLGLVERRVIEASGAVNEPTYVRNELKLDRIKGLFDDPAAHFANVYGWGTASFDPISIMRAVLVFYRPESSIKVDKIGADAFLDVGPFRWSRDSSINPPGLMLDYSASWAKTFQERVEISEKWGMDFKTDLSIGGGIIFRLKPPFEVSAEPKAGTASGAVSFTVNRNPSARGMTIIGGNDLLHLTVDDVGVGAELVIGASTSGRVDIDPSVFAELKKLTITLGSEGSDSFLASLLSSVDVKGTFDLGLIWKMSEGLVIKGAGAIEIAIPMHQSIGPVTFETLYLILKLESDGSLSLEASAGITGQLGPFAAAVERMGVILTIGFSAGADKDLGPLDLSLKFKPPNGVGLSVDAGVVRGGGYLYLDFDKGEYAGALELVFSGFLSLKAIGLISTKMPDGSPGFSLLIVITAEFGTPLQLGFGFTLIGVGGLLGLHRTMRLEELAEGVRTGSVESVMFPRDVIANAPRIISDMKRFFPPLSDVFLIGPMAKLGWGTPTLISASLGIIVEVPPGNIAILGVIKCALPDEDFALLILQVKFIGALEPAKKRLWFFASLFGSRVLFITISGDMALLISWGSNPTFVLSVGGFHPKFNPPALPMPVPQRVAISILNESWARIRVEGYFAVTSNTAQFGARVELFFGVSDFSVDGHLGFDALFQFSPFYFIISFSASMSVRVFGAGLFSVRIRGELEGTSPWHVEGEGSISVLFLDIDVPFSHTWGESADTVLPEIPALPILKGELEKRENWRALPPAGGHLSVTLRNIEANNDLVLHPLGTLHISQRAVPLDLSIQKVGNQKIADIDKAVLKVDTPGLRQKNTLQEPFATAQFRDLDAAAKLSAPGYEKQTAGTEVSVSGSDVRTSHAAKRIVLHELIIVDNNYKSALKRFFNIGKRVFDLLLGSNAIALSPLSQATKTQKVPFPEKVMVGDTGFVIADLRDNTVWGGSTTFTSQSKAADALAANLKAHPDMSGGFHVIPAAEATAV